MHFNIAGTWAENWDLFVEIGAAASVSTRLLRVLVSKKTEESGAFRAFLHFAPIFAAAFFLAFIYFWSAGGVVLLHAVTIGGMSGNLRDVFAASLERLKLPKAEPSPEPGRAIDMQEAGEEGSAGGAGER